MERGCFYNFFKYSSLNVLGMLGLSFYILADTFFIARGMGSDGLTALNLAIPVYSLIHGSGLMLGMGGGIHYSLRKNTGARQTTDGIFTHTLLLGGLFSLVFVFLGVFFSEPLVHLLGADDRVFAMTETYLQVILLFSPAFICNNILLSFIRNDAAPQLAMAAMLGGSFSNVILDYVFIFPLDMEIFGAVLATDLAPIISILILSIHFIRKRNQFRPVLCRLQPRILRDLCASGMPSLITELSSGIVILVFNAILLHLGGNTAVAAYGVIANISLVVVAIYTGIAQGIQPLISSSIAAGRKEERSRLLTYAVCSVGILSGLLYTLMFFGASQIVAVFNSEGNSLLQSIATEGIRLYFIACPFAGYNIILTGFFTAAGQSLPAQLLSLLRGFLLIIPSALLLSFLAGVTGVWISFPATECITALTGLLLFFLKKRTMSG